MHGDVNLVHHVHFLGIGLIVTAYTLEKMRVEIGQVELAVGTVVHVGYGELKRITVTCGRLIVGSKKKKKKSL